MIVPYAFSGVFIFRLVASKLYISIKSNSRQAVNIIDTIFLLFSYSSTCWLDRVSILFDRVDVPLARNTHHQHKVHHQFSGVFLRKHRPDVCIRFQDV